MAIAISVPTASTASTANATTYAMGAYTPTANSLQVLAVVASDTTAVGDVSGGNVAWIRETSALMQGIDTLYLFWARIGSSPVSTTITFNCAADAATGCIMHVIEVTGYDETTQNPIKQFTSNFATSTNANATYGAALGTNNGYFLYWVGSLGANSSTPPAGWTEVGDVAYVTPATNSSAAYRATGETGTAYSFTNNNTDWYCIGCEIYTAGAGPVTTIKKLSALGAG